jgi:uncharacterized protein YprB with RNaseH-like and TPR domain
MIIKENIINTDYEKYIPNHLKKLFSTNFIILDIETTGFSREKASVILIGLLIKNKNRLISKQIFSETLDEEPSILLKLMDILNSLNDYFFITYNGHSFDLPFLNSKFSQHEIKYQINLNNNFDLYRLIRKNKELLNLKRYNLKTIEKFLGINRCDTISGKESIQLYYDYIKTGSENKLNKILLHNYEDIKYLIPLLEILSYFSYNQIMTVYPKKIGINCFLEDWTIHKNFLILSITDIENPHVNYFDEFCTIKSTLNQLTIKIALKEFLINDVKYHLINHKVFYKKDFDDLEPKIKNDLIVAIKNEIQFDKLLHNLKRIITKYNIKKVSMDN